VTAPSPIAFQANRDAPPAVRRLIGSADQPRGSGGWATPLRVFSSRGLSVAAGLAALMLAFNIPLVRRNARTLAEHGAAVMRTHATITNLTQVMALTNGASAGVRGFITTGDSVYLVPHRLAVDSLPFVFNRVDSLTAERPAQRDQLPLLRRRISTHLAGLGDGVVLRASARTEAAEAWVRSGVDQRHLEAVRSLAVRMRQEEQRELAARTSEAADAYREVLRSGMLAAVAAFLSFVALLLLVRRNIEARAAALQETQSQRAYFENTLRSIDDAVITTDQRDRVSGMNAAAERLTGWAESEATGCALSTVLVTRATATAPWTDAETVPCTPALLLAVITRGGTERHVEQRRSAIRNAELVQVGSVVVLTDVTDRQNAQVRLEESEQRLRSALRIAGMIAWELDVGTSRLTVSENAGALLGLRDDQTLLDLPSALTLCHPADLGLLKLALSATMETGVTLDTVCRIVRPVDGVIRWMHVRADVLEESPRRVVGTLLDTTERRLAQDDIARLSTLLHAINDVTPDYVFTKDRDGRVTYANAATRRGVGIPFDEMIGKTDLEFLTNQEHARIIMATDQRIMRSGRQEMVDEILDLPGGRRWFYSAKLPQRNAAGDVVGLIGMSRDITERKLVEEALAESEGRFRAMADSAPVMIWISDEAGRFTYTNAQWRTFVGTSFDGSVDIPQVLHPEDAPRFAQMMNALPTQRGTMTSEYRVRRADGRFRWVLCTATPRLGETGRFVGGIGSVLDIEDRKMLENDLRVLAADLSAADRRKDEFLATLAHELRNPLAPIRNGLEILRLALPPNDAIERTRGMMERQLVQIVRLVDDLLDISRISSGKLSLQRERIDLRDALTLAVESTAASFASRRQRLVYTRSATRICVDGDLARLGQVFTNLLDNAAKYSSDEGLIWLSVHPEGTMVDVRVRDRGQGIPAAMLHEVFEMFIQVDRTLERSQGGLGIGLTLVKRLVEMHGGSVRAHSDGVDQGSEFAVRLPLVSDETRRLLDGAHQTQPMDEPRRVILIADDNADGAATLAMMLGARGHDVHTANDGLSAVAMAGALQPSLVLLDIGMPGLNGYEVCQRLRAEPWGQQATIVALTGWGQEEDRRRSTDAGFDHHVVKPVDPACLEQLVRDVHAHPPPSAS
jgi:PAS domain S-box-containing protein